MYWLLLLLTYLLLLLLLLSYHHRHRQPCYFTFSLFSFPKMFIHAILVYENVYSCSSEHSTLIRPTRHPWFLSMFSHHQGINSMAKRWCPHHQLSVTSWGHKTWRYTPRILNLGNRWRWQFSFTSWTLYPGKWNSVPTGWENRWAPQPN